MKPQQKRYLKDLVVEMWWKNLFEGFLHLSHSQFWNYDNSIVFHPVPGDNPFRDLEAMVGLLMAAKTQEH